MVNPFLTPVPHYYSGPIGKAELALALGKDCLSNVSPFPLAPLHSARSTRDDSCGISAWRLRPDRSAVPLEEQLLLGRHADVGERGGRRHHPMGRGLPQESARSAYGAWLCESAEGDRDARP